MPPEEMDPTNEGIPESSDFGGSRSDASHSGQAPASDPSVGPARTGGWWRSVFELVRSVGLLLVLLFVVRAFVVEAFKIPTTSMEGTLLAGDFLLVNKAVYGAEIPGVGITLPALAIPERGEVVVFHPPHDPGKHYVKRLVGLPGHTLEMRNKLLYLNGEELYEPYTSHHDWDGDTVHPGMSWQNEFLKNPVATRRYRPSRDNWGPLVIPGGSFFMLGDNRDNSEDSRYWGLVDREKIKGRPWRVYYSSEPGQAGLGSWFQEVRWGRIGGRIR